MNNFYKILDKLENVPRHIFWRCYLGFWGVLIYTLVIIALVKMLG